jgi:triphosphoribosyl-dephospho-CoA synthase
MHPETLSLGQLAGLACVWEASASKPGNVHRGADFDDLTYIDFVTSAVAIGQALDRAAEGARLGDCVHAAIAATRGLIRTNSNLGTVLLLVPLALPPAGHNLRQGLSEVLEGLDERDAQLVYEAIRLAQPGGLGRVEEGDVHAEPPADLLYVMRLAAERDLVARQYINDFQQVFEFGLPELTHGLDRGWPLNDTIIRLQLRLMSEFPDSLIARKCGAATARQAADRAAAALAAGLPGEESYGRALADFDFWLRADHHRRNPGTTADLIAATLFAGLREGMVPLPVRFYG